MSYPWFALQVRSRFENIVTAHLSGMGYESFLPLYMCRRRWSDRFKEIECPLFPGYVFCRLNPLNRLPILMIPGVSLIVGMGKTPISIDEAEIAGDTVRGQVWAPEPTLAIRTNWTKGANRAWTSLRAGGRLIGFQGAPSPRVVCHASPALHCSSSRRCLGNTNSPTGPGLRWLGEHPSGRP